MRICPFFFLLLLLAGCGSSFDSPSQRVGSTAGWIAPDPSTRATQLQQAVDRAMAANQLPGALVGVFTPQGRWTSATGFADVGAAQAIDLADNSAWRSITKSFTVTLMLQLVAEGVLDLDAPVGTYVAGVPSGHIITLRQLAEMRSGLFSYTQDQRFIDGLTADLQQPWTDQQLLGFAFDHPLNFTPGSQYEYSNTNTILLGVVVETMSGQSYQHLLQTRILGPLALAHTTFMTGVDLPSPAAKGYVFDDDSGQYEEVQINSTGLSSAGALAGTLADLQAWGAALVSGVLLPPELQRQRFLSGPATNGPIYDSYGLGMGELRGWWGHTGVGLGYQAAVFTEPVSGSQIVIMLNATNENQDVPADITLEFLRILNWTR